MPRKKPKLIPKGDSLMRLIKDMDRMVVEGVSAAALSCGIFGSSGGRVVEGL